MEVPVLGMELLFGHFVTKWTVYDREVSIRRGPAVLQQGNK